jgi:hypothetical protein
MFHSTYSIESEIGINDSITLFNNIQPLDKHSANGAALGPNLKRIMQEKMKTKIVGKNKSFKVYHEIKRIKKPVAQIPRREMSELSPPPFETGRNKVCRIIINL